MTILVLSPSRGRERVENCTHLEESVYNRFSMNCYHLRLVVRIQKVLHKRDKTLVLSSIIQKSWRAPILSQLESWSSHPSYMSLDANQLRHSSTSLQDASGKIRRLQLCHVFQQHTDVVHVILNHLTKEYTNILLSFILHQSDYRLHFYTVFSS